MVCFEIVPRHRRSRKALQQDLTFVQESGGAIAALEREVLDEGLLQDRELAVLGVAFHRADGFAVEAHRRHDAGRAGVARAVGVIDDHRAAQALRGAAAELRAGQPEMLAQEVVHRQIVAHVRSGHTRDR